MTFSADAWSRTADTFEAIRTMPFNEALADGTLPRDRFVRYVVQDAHYLVAFGRALAVAAAKAPTADEIIRFSKAAEEAIVVERSLHAGFFETFGISEADFEATPLAPSAHHYVSYLSSTAWSEPYEVVLAALLPCFWIYAEVGRDILKRAASPNPYQAWIDTYAGEDFHEAVRGVIGATDRAAEAASPGTVERMHEAYRTAARLEYLFWHSAWTLEDWPI